MENGKRAQRSPAPILRAPPLPAPHKVPLVSPRDPLGQTEGGGEPAPLTDPEPHFLPQSESSNTTNNSSSLCYVPPYLTSFSSYYTPLGSRHHSHLSDEPPEALRPSCLAKDTQPLKEDREEGLAVCPWTRELPSLSLSSQIAKLG